MRSVEGASHLYNSRKKRSASIVIGKSGANSPSLCPLGPHDTYAPAMYCTGTKSGTSTSAHFWIEWRHFSRSSPGCAHHRAKVRSRSTIVRPAGAGRKRTYLLPALLSVTTTFGMSSTPGMTLSTQICSCTSLLLSSIGLRGQMYKFAYSCKARPFGTTTAARRSCTP
jgi:hypothetical protein